MPERRFSRIAAGNYHTLALDYNGHLWGFGMNMGGQLGDADRQDKIIPVEIMGKRTFTDVSAKGTHSLAVDSDGNLWAFGANQYGQLGDGSNTNRTTPVQIGGGTAFEHVYTGWYHTAASDVAGNLWGWGSNRYGQLGDGTTTNRNTPILLGGESQEGRESRYLVLYCSRTSNTEGVAQRIGTALGCDVVEVEPETPYDTDYNAMLERAQQEQAAIEAGNFPPVKTSVESLEEYEVIFIGYPIWYGHMATPMQTFLHEHAAKLAGKRIALFATSGSSGISTSVSDARKHCPDAIYTESLLLTSSTLSQAESRVAEWLSDIGITINN